MKPLAASLLALLMLTDVTAALAAPGSADEIIAEVRRATARYVDIERAREDGFVRVSGMEARHGVHFVNVRTQVLATAAAALGGAVDLTRPPMLLYVERGGQWQLVGVEYALPTAPSTSPFPGAPWEHHEASCHYQDGGEVAAPRASACPERHPKSGAAFIFWHPELSFVHVWAWYPNPDGPFAAEDPYLQPWGGSVASEGAHHHGRTGAEIAYSEFNHRISGLFLLVIALLTAWVTRAGGHRTSGLVLGAFWILFGVYILITADPDVWPLGPRGWRDALSEPVPVEHKLLSLLPMAIGVVEALRAAGLATGTAWKRTVSALMVLGGVGLFTHRHGGGVSWDRTFVQHAAMGAAGFTAAVVLVVSDRVHRWAERLRWGWPALLLVTSLVLLFYTE